MLCDLDHHNIEALLYIIFIMCQISMVFVYTKDQLSASKNIMTAYDEYQYKLQIYYIIIFISKKLQHMLDWLKTYHQYV